MRDFENDRTIAILVRNIKDLEKTLKIAVGGARNDTRKRIKQLFDELYVMCAYRGYDSREVRKFYDLKER